MNHPEPLLRDLRNTARDAPESGIVETMNYGRSQQREIMPFWVGEGDLPTPAFIGEAAARGIANHETFYTWQRGIPELRRALADYHTRLYGRTFSPDEFYVTGSGMQSIQIAVAMTAGAGDEVIIPTPAWPNAAAAAEIAGAKGVTPPMRFGNDGWTLDLDQLRSAMNARTRAIVVVSPSNPTGWTATPDELRSLIALSREKKVWLIADETYARFWYGEGHRAPSFFDVMAPDDRILFVNTFSKNWAMTGWRMGWLVANPALGQVIENLVQYSTSGVAQFMQRAGVVALERGEDFIVQQVTRAKINRDILCDALEKTGRCRFARPKGAFYLFFSVDGEPDSRALCRRLIDKAGIGLAPGTAFGAGGSQFVRMCFARKPEDIALAAERLSEQLR